MNKYNDFYDEVYFRVILKINKELFDEQIITYKMYHYVEREILNKFKATGG